MYNLKNASLQRASVSVHCTKPVMRQYFQQQRQVASLNIVQEGTRRRIMEGRYCWVLEK